MDNHVGINRFFRSEAIQSLKECTCDGTIRSVLEDWRWIINYSKKYRWAIIIYIVLGILSATLGLGTVVLTKYMIDIIVNRRIDQVGILICLMIFSAVSGLFFHAVAKRLSVKISIYVNNEIQADIFEKIMDTEWISINKFSSGDLLNRFSNDIKSVASNAVNWLPDLIIQIYTFASTFIVICYYDWIMAVLAFFSAPYFMLTGKYILKNIQSRKKKVLEVNSDMMTFQAETFYNYDTIKSFGIVDRYHEKLEKWQKEYTESNLEYNFFSIKSSVWMQVQTTLVGFAAFSYCLFRLWTGSITYGTMTLFLQQRSKLSSNFDSLVKVFPNMVNSAVAAHRVREIAELPKEQHCVQNMKLSLEKGVTVKMEDVSVAYVGEQKVLEHSNFLAGPNEIVALIGASGEGKTTILRLFLAMIRPDAGKVVMITVDGKEYPLNADLRSLFSYVPQGNTLLSGTIAENMRLVKADATEEQIIDALKIACAWEFVEKKDLGIYEKLGEHGKGVSEGEAQRLSIARAVLRDAPILLLDEATSALDVETERKVLRNIMKQCPNKTCIVSTHRPGVLTMCQRIYRISGMKITEQDSESSRHMRKEF